MKMYGFPIADLNNEAVLEGKKAWIVLRKIFIAIATISTVETVFFCGVIDEEFLFLPLMFGVIAVLF